MSKLTHTEISEYYRNIHRQALIENASNALAPVIYPGSAMALNEFVNYAHKLGMSRALDFLEAELKGLRGRKVLDLGCGRGRWSIEYGQRGAGVTGIDISPEAIQVLSEQLPQHRFICGDITEELPIAIGAFDIVSAVTVLQHLPCDRQSRVFFLVEKYLKPGGYLVLLERIGQSDSAHLFEHPPEGWINMASEQGLAAVRSWGSNYEVCVRLAGLISKHIGIMYDDTLDPRRGTKDRSSLKLIVSSFLGRVSFPIEWLCNRVPLAPPTHQVLIFCKNHLLQ